MEEWGCSAIGRPSGGPAPPGDDGGPIVLPPEPPTVPPPAFQVPERGQIVVQTVARMVDSQAEDRGVYNLGEPVRVLATFLLDWPHPLQTQIVYQWISPNQVPFTPTIRRNLLQPAPMDIGDPPSLVTSARFDPPQVPSSIGQWSLEINVFLEVERERVYPIAFAHVLGFTVL